jgi:CRISPR-associated protein Cas2
MNPTPRSEYKSVWLFAMFDLPVKEREHRRRYARFRNALLREGFSKLQFSVYAIHCESEADGLRLRRTIERQLPKEGQVRLMIVTDRQFAKMQVFFGKKQVNTECVPDQLLLF